MSISVSVRYGGRFVRDWLINYTGGNVKLFEGLDIEKWSYFEICGIVEQDLEVKKQYRLWWMPDEYVDFRIIRFDEDANEIKDYAVKKNRVVNIFVEHDVDDVSRLVDIPNCVISNHMALYPEQAHHPRSTNHMYFFSSNCNTSKTDVQDSLLCWKCR